MAEKSQVERLKIKITEAMLEGFEIGTTEVQIGERVNDIFWEWIPESRTQAEEMIERYKNIGCNKSLCDKMKRLNDSTCLNCAVWNKFKSDFMKKMFGGGERV